MKNGPVNLRKLIEAMDNEGDFASTFYWIVGNEFITIDREAHRWVKDALDIKDAPDWMKNQLHHAKAIEENYSSDYYAIPNRFDIDENAMMKRFLNRVYDIDSAHRLEAVSGKGNIRKYKALLVELNLIDHWYGFKNTWYKEIAIGWCDKYKLPYSD